MASRVKIIAVYLEVAPKRTFGVAVDWPGWARSGRTEADAIDALLAYAPRYASAVGSAFEAPMSISAFEIVERLAGGATTEFGAPGTIPKADAAELDPAELKRQIGLLRAAWKALDAAAGAARGVTLTTGPRGGGRDLAKMLDHVVGAEASYLRQLGARFTGDDVHALRDVVVESLRAVAGGERPANPTAVKKPWPPRYFVRRAAWHVLDHAWELEDRSSHSP